MQDESISGVLDGGKEKGEDKLTTFKTGRTACHTMWSLASCLGYSR